jgi:hypothetical protein
MANCIVRLYVQKQNHALLSDAVTKHSKNRNANTATPEPKELDASFVKDVFASICTAVKSVEKHRDVAELVKSGLISKKSTF